MKFVKCFFVCDEEVMQTDNIITYCFLVKEALREYSNIVDSNWWVSTDSKKNSKDETLFMMASNVAIEYPVNNTVKKFYNKNRHKGKDNNSAVEWFRKSAVTCHKCGKRGH